MHVYVLTSTCFDEFEYKGYVYVRCITLFDFYMHT